MLVVNARFLTQTVTGVQRYAIEISRELKKIYPNIVFVSPKKILHQEIAEELGVVAYGSLSGHSWEQLELPLFLKKKNNPLLLSLTNTAPVFFRNKISVIHDLSFLRFAQSYSWKFRFFYRFLIPMVVKTSLRLVTVSDFSRNELAVEYGVSKENIDVVHCAVSHGFSKRVKCVERYILAVSSLTYQKNFHSLVKAFNSLPDSGVKMRLVGGINRNFASHELLAEIDSNKNIVFLGRVSDEELVDLYSNALFFVHPTLFEGFGIPPLEAQACGCPCVVSNVASLPEVCGDSVVYCDPYDVGDIARQISLLMNDSGLRDRLVERGYINVKRFSWGASARRLADIIEGQLCE